MTADGGNMYQAYDCSVWILPIADNIDAPQEDLFGAEIVNENSKYIYDWERQVEY